jgi:hypothetical protein
MAPMGEIGGGLIFVSKYARRFALVLTHISKHLYCLSHSFFAAQALKTDPLGLRIVTRETEQLHPPLFLSPRPGSNASEKMPCCLFVAQEKNTFNFYVNKRRIEPL